MDDPSEVYDDESGQLPPGFEIPYSDAEIEALRQTRTGRTLEQILEELGY